MEKRVVSTTFYRFDFSGYKSFKNLLLNAEGDEILEYSPIKFEGYELKLKYNIATKKLEIKWGCVNVNIDKLFKGYKQIMGEDISETKKGLKKIKPDGTLGKTLTTNIIEESENFFISSSGKVYKKSEYQETEYKSNPNIIIWKGGYYSWDSGWMFSGTKISSNENDKKRIIDVFEYLIEIYNFLKENYGVQNK